MLGKGVWPPGAYVCKVVGIGHTRRTVAGNLAKVVRVQIVGVQHEPFFWWLIDEKWAWQDLLPSFEQADLLLGRSFLFVVRVDEYNGVRRNLVGGHPPLAEVIT